MISIIRLSIGYGFDPQGAWLRVGVVNTIVCRKSAIQLDTIVYTSEWSYPLLIQNNNNTYIFFYIAPLHEFNALIYIHVHESVKFAKLIIHKQSTNNVYVLQSAKMWNMPIKHVAYNYIRGAFLRQCCCCWCCSIPQLNTRRVTDYMHPHPYMYKYRYSP